LEYQLDMDENYGSSLFVWVKIIAEFESSQVKKRNIKLEFGFQ